MDPLKNTVSIKKNHEFQRLYHKGKSAASPFLAIYTRRNRGGGNRLGLTVGKKVGAPSPATGCAAGSKRSAGSTRGNCRQAATWWSWPGSARLSPAISSWRSLFSPWRTSWAFGRGTRREAGAFMAHPGLPGAHLSHPSALLPFSAHLQPVRAGGGGEVRRLEGGWLALKRILRCQPFHRQKSVEYDPVP